MTLSFKLFIKSIFPLKPLNVAYDSGGNKKETIVLLHGIAATSGTWNHLIKKLDDEKHRILALDLLGFGSSPRPIACRYSVEDHVVYIRKTLKKMRVKKPFLIVGHSMGSIIAARYAKEYPKDVSRLYLLSIPIYKKYLGSKKDIKSLQNDIFIKIYRFLLDNKKFTIQQSQFIRKLLQVDDGIEVNEDNWESFRLSMENTIIDQNSYADIASIKMPVRVIYGNLDEFLVQDNIKELSALRNVEITRLNIVDHSVGKRFAKEAARLINEHL